MPPKSKYRRRSAPRRTRRTGKGYKTLVNVGLNPIPQRYITKMKYCDSLPMPTAVLGVQSYRFNLNSIFDPNRTGGGHQPYGHDTLQTLYNRYRVIGCSYTISAISSTYSLNVAALPSNEEVTVSSLSEAKEKPRAKFITQSPGGTIKTLKGYVSMPSLMGRTKAQYIADDRYQAQYGADPNELAILNIYAQNINDDTSAPAAQLTVVLEFLVESFDVKMLGLS